MDDQVTVRLLLSAGAAVIGLAFLAYGAWARHGGSPGARRWMGNEFGNEPFNERMTVLGGPLFGLICLCFALGVLPVIGRYLMLDRKSTRLNSSHVAISYAGFCFKNNTES